MLLLEPNLNPYPNSNSIPYSILNLKVNHYEDGKPFLPEILSPQHRITIIFASGYFYSSYCVILITISSSSSPPLLLSSFSPLPSLSSSRCRHRHIITIMIGIIVHLVLYLCLIFFNGYRQPEVGKHFGSDSMT